MANLMLFGTRNRMAFIPCPIAPYAHTVTRSRADFAMSNGATLVRTARMPRQTFELTWMDTLANVQPVIEMGRENSGPPYYFLDPGILANAWNALPPHWAAPGWFMSTSGGLAADFSGQFSMMSRSQGVMSDGSVTTPGAYVAALPGCPDIGVQFTVPSVPAGPYPMKLQSSGGVQPYLMDSGVLKATPPSATILVPPNYKLVTRVVQDAAAGVSVCVTWRVSTTGRFSTIWSVSPALAYLGNTAGVSTTTVFTATSTQWGMADVWLGPSAAGGGGVLSLYALEAYVIPSAATIPAAYSQGRGQMPLWPTQDDMQIQTYGVALADARKQHGITWPMMEGDISW